MLNTLMKEISMKMRSSQAKELWLVQKEYTQDSLQGEWGTDREFFNIWVASDTKELIKTMNDTEKAKFTARINQ